jgi:hypothetical protein
MPSCLTRLIRAFTTEVMLAGTRYVAKTHTHRQERREAGEAFAKAQCEAAETAARAQREAHEATVRQRAAQAVHNRATEDQQSEFRKKNERWGADVQAYEDVMKQQDEEIEMLEELRGYRQCGLREQKVRVEEHVDISGLQDESDSAANSDPWYDSDGMLRSDAGQDSRYTELRDSGARKTSRIRDSGVSVLAEWTRHVEIPPEVFITAAVDPILEAQLHRPLWVPWYERY